MIQRKYWYKDLVLLVKENYKLHICILIAFLVGCLLAALFAFTLSPLACEELLLYFSDFFQNISETGTDAGLLFKTGLLRNLQNFLVLFLFSVMVIGAPFIAGFVTVHSFVHSFTLFFMFRLYGAKTLLFILAGILPHYLLLIPCYLFLCVSCLQFSLSLLKDRQEPAKKISILLGKLVFFYLLSIMAALLQAYVEPLLIRLISGIYLS